MIIKKIAILPVLITLFFIASCNEEEKQQPDYTASIVGEYDVTEKTSTYTQYYDITVEKSSTGENKVVIHHLDAFESITVADVTIDSLIIPLQNYRSNQYISGSGTYTAGRLDIKFTLVDNVTRTCVALKKQ